MMGLRVVYICSICILFALISSGCTPRGSDPSSAPPISIDNSLNYLGAPCDLANVRSVLVPKDYDHPELGQMVVAYQVHPGSDPNAPTIVYIPGGPGVPMIGSARSNVPPETFTQIFVDQRGTGCSSHTKEQLPDDAFRSTYSARDLLAIIKAAELKTYFLQGNSFGTVVASMAASLLESQAELPLPRAIVLEGTVGKGWDDYNTFFTGHQTEWRRIRAMLPARAIQRLTADPLPLGMSAKDWATYIFVNNYTGDIPVSGGNAVANLLSGLSLDSPTKDAEIRTAIMEEFLKKNALVNTKQTTRMGLVIGCREIWLNHNLSSRLLLGGELVNSGDEKCSWNSKTEIYDSKKFNHSIPTIYFQGEFDPATRVADGEYHFLEHTNANRAFIKVFGAAHYPMSYQLQSAGCTKNIWNYMAYSSESLASALSRCTGVTVELSVKIKGQ